MKSTLVLMTTLWLGLGASAQGLSEEDDQAIRMGMVQQIKCWNRGDINCFMQSYWDSDELRFIGKNGVTEGYDAVLANYKRKYPDKDKMGRLKYNIISLEGFGENTALMIGKWALDIKKAPQGHFTLIWKKIEGEWVIILDHTS